MLMTRARKLYQAIETILTIIKLIEKLRTLEGGTVYNQAPTTILDLDK